jgi:dihydropteroate synthase
MNLFQQLQQVGQDIKQGYQTADITQRRMFAKAKQEGLGYGQSILDPGFKKKLPLKGLRLVRRLLSLRVLIFHVLLLISPMTVRVLIGGVGTIR